MKRYYDLTSAEKLVLTEDDFYKAVKIEAIERGIRPPITLDEHMKQQGFRGFTVPPDSVAFYEIILPERYGQAKRTGISFRTLEAANAAIQGAVTLTEEDYTTKLRSVGVENPQVAQTWITLVKPQSYGVILEDAPPPSAEWDKLCDECREDFNAVCQSDYNRKVALRKREEYINLAGGDEEIARRFWNKVESGDFPQPEQIAA